MNAIEAVYKQAVEHFRAARYGDAERLCRQILSKYADHAQSLHLLGLTAHRNGNLPEALRRLETAVRLKPNQTVYLNSLGMVLFAMGRTAEAIETLSRAVALGPDRPDPYNNLGVSLNHEHRYSEALAQFTRALEIQPGDAEICNNIGITLYGLRRYTEAVKFHTQAIEQDRSFTQAYFHRGRDWRYTPGRLNWTAVFFRRITTGQISWCCWDIIMRPSLIFRGRLNYILTLRMPTGIAGWRIF